MHQYESSWSGMSARVRSSFVWLRMIIMWNKGFLTKIMQHANELREKKKVIEISMYLPWPEYWYFENYILLVLPS